MQQPAALSFAGGVTNIGSDGRLTTTAFFSAGPPPGSDPNAIYSFSVNFRWCSFTPRK